MCVCVCECSWRATWPQVSERLCRGSCWRWRVCTARCAPATPSSRPWFAGSAACSDSPKAETDTQKYKHWPRLSVYVKTSAKQHHITTKDFNFLLFLATPLLFTDLLQLLSWVFRDVSGITTRGAFCVTSPNYIWLTSNFLKWEKETCTVMKFLLVKRIWYSFVWSDFSLFLFFFCENKRFLNLLDSCLVYVVGNGEHLLTCTENTVCVNGNVQWLFVPQWRSHFAFSFRHTCSIKISPFSGVSLITRHLDTVDHFWQTATFNLTYFYMRVWVDSLWKTYQEKQNKEPKWDVSLWK